MHSKTSILDMRRYRDLGKLPIIHFAGMATANRTSDSARFYRRRCYILVVGLHPTQAECIFGYPSHMMLCASISPAFLRWQKYLLTVATLDLLHWIYIARVRGKSSCPLDLVWYEPFESSFPFGSHPFPRHVVPYHGYSR